MRAEVLVSRGAREALARSPLYTYAVPERLAAALRPGQLVAIPFGERAAVGIVWALDAADEVDRERGVAAPLPFSLRSIDAILLPEPLLLPAQRALAEWISDHYAAPLAAAVRPLLPPGLLSGVRLVLRPTGSMLEAPAGGAVVPEDEAVVLARLRERGWLAYSQVEEALGVARAGAAIHTLLEHGHVTLTAEIPDPFTRSRSERRVRLLALSDTLEEWRADARAALDRRPAEGGAVARVPSGRSGSPERRAERVLRQLAVLDVLARPSRGVDALRNGVWRLEDLCRLTRASAPTLAELEAAGLIAVEDAEVRHDPLAGQAIARTEPLALTPAQAAALAAILAEPSGGEPRARTFLLHGITGSGKTEVYLQALAAVLARGERGIVLVPEIALTPQAMARYAGRFPGRVALLHSGLTNAERLYEWRRIHAGQVALVLGSRSALFAPVDRLGLIIVDEEHEAAYKQERIPTYSARDAAVHLGALAGAAVVLGSATPSVESYWLATHGAYRLLELRERAPATATSSVAPPPGETPPGEGEPWERSRLPAVSVVDLRAELRAGNMSILSESLRTALQETLDRGEQAILFLNRRGTANCVVCRACGYVACCGGCDISMTYHAGDRALICHYCGKRQPPPTLCPVCRDTAIRYFGLGTERVEATVKRQFPTARVLRWDRDTARTRQAHEELLRAFTERRADILVGTQMIAKGLDLPAVTLVGAVAADVALFLPDFRASERAFQLLTQVAGRAGRGEQPGRVVIQTFNPEHFCIQTAARHDYGAFIAAELDARQRYGYPPLRRFVQFTYAHSDRYAAQVEATVVAERLERAISDLSLPETDLVGPAPAFLERLRGRYRWQVILRSPDPRPLLRLLLAERLSGGWSVDVDPASTL
ncbi:MAG: primosomal protein N' [Ktedonobacterales bacterium]|nr:primosomal protein N' [Ktedonobacterales bacterium]